MFLRRDKYITTHVKPSQLLSIYFSFFQLPLSKYVELLDKDDHRFWRVYVPADGWHVPLPPWVSRNEWVDALDALKVTDPGVGSPGLSAPCSGVPDLAK